MTGCEVVGGRGWLTVKWDTSEEEEQMRQQVKETHVKELIVWITCCDLTGGLINPRCDHVCRIT